MGAVLFTNAKQITVILFQDDYYTVVLMIPLGSTNLEEVLGSLVQGAVSFPDPTVGIIILHWCKII